MTTDTWKMQILNFPGFGITFGRDLEPSIEGYSGQLIEDSWIFKEGDLSTQLNIFK